jgi:hypothetical protein
MNINPTSSRSDASFETAINDLETLLDSEGILPPGKQSVRPKAMSL